MGVAELEFEIRLLLAQEVGVLSRSQVSEMKSLKKNEWLKKIIADLNLDKVILKNRLDHLKPRAA